MKNIDTFESRMENPNYIKELLILIRKIYEEYPYDPNNKTEIDEYIQELLYILENDNKHDLMFYVMGLREPKLNWVPK